MGARGADVAGHVQRVRKGRVILGQRPPGLRVPAVAPQAKTWRWVVCQTQQSAVQAGRAVCPHASTGFRISSFKMYLRINCIHVLLYLHSMKMTKHKI